MRYTEHEKLSKVKERSQAIGAFYHWAVDVGYISNRKRFELEKVLADFFNIDLQKIENEKKQMLEELRNNRG